MQAQYRNYPQSTQRSPHATAGRRGPGPMVASGHGQPPPLTPQQIQAAQAAEAHKRELGKRQSRRPTDKDIPDTFKEIVIGDGVQRYQALRDVERRLDAVMMRKRFDIQDSANRNMKRYRTLRIWVSNTVDNQPWQMTGMDPDAFDFGGESQATYRVRIEGRLLDDESDIEAAADGDDDADKDGEADDMAKDSMEGIEKEGAKERKASVGLATSQRSKFSHFFKSIIIEYDRSKSLNPDSFAPIEWTKPGRGEGAGAHSGSADAEFDCLEFERKGDENLNITINLVRDENPERFKLSKALAEVLDTEEEDRAGIVMGIWEYVKAMGLQEDEESRKIKCDDKLRAVFHSDIVLFPYVPNLIMPHIEPLPPLQIPYTIRVDRAYHTQTPPSDPTSRPSSVDPAPSSPQSQYTIYDIRVPLDDPLRSLYLNSIHSPNTVSVLTQLNAFDEALAGTIQALGHARAKHDFYAALARDPARFLRRWVSSQRRDLEVLLGEATRGGGEEGQSEEWRRGGANGVWGGTEAREGVGLWLARQKAH